MTTTDTLRVIDCVDIKKCECQYMPRKMTHKVETAPQVVKVSTLSLKGIGIFATVDFSPGAFLFQYTGELIEEAEAEQRKKNVERWVKAASCIILNTTAKLDGTCHLLPC